MNIDELTIGEARQLAAMFSGQPAVMGGAPKPLVGGFVIVRCRDAGVHAGTLIDYEGRNVTLKNSRRLWYWKCAENQHSLSGVASVGIDQNKSKIPAAVGTLVLSDACEILETTEKSATSIKEAPIYEVN